MKKSSKAALAAGAAIVVLTGGAGSLAFWSATTDIDGGEVDSGELSLEPIAGGGWGFNGTPVADPTAVVLVPGDVLTYSGSYTVGAVGDTVAATVAAIGADGTGGLAPFVETTLTSTVDGAAVTTIDESNDGDVLAVELEVDFPFGDAADNASQQLTLDLTDVAIVLEQTDATP